MNGPLLHSIGSSVAKLGADLLIGQTRASQGPEAMAPPPRVFADPMLAEEGAVSALVQLKALGITENEALRAVVRAEADRRVHEKINEVYSAAWDQSAAAHRQDSSSIPWTWALLGFAGGIAATLVITSVVSSRTGCTAK